MAINYVNVNRRKTKVIKIIEGDLFCSDARIIAHQVNCQGKMGSGVALQVKRKYPNVYNEYMKVCSADMLGKIQIVPVDIQIVKRNMMKILFLIMLKKFLRVLNVEDW